jgi:hypothetical protein
MVEREGFSPTIQMVLRTCPRPVVAGTQFKTVQSTSTVSTANGVFGSDVAAEKCWNCFSVVPVLDTTCLYVERH